MPERHFINTTTSIIDFLVRNKDSLVSLSLRIDKNHVKIHKCPSGTYILTKYPFICNLLLSPIQYTATTTSGQNVPNSFPQTWLWVVYPPSPHIVQNSRELSFKGASAPPFIGGVPLTGGPGCSIFQRCDGGISSRAAPFPNLGKGCGIGLNITEVLLMNFTNSPYERMMKEVPR